VARGGTVVFGKKEIKTQRESTRRRSRRQGAHRRRGEERGGWVCRGADREVGPRKEHPGSGDCVDGCHPQHLGDVVESLAPHVLAPRKYKDLGFSGFISLDAV
jgi:hypothetical protein